MPDSIYPRGDALLSDRLESFLTDDVIRRVMPKNRQPAAWSKALATAGRRYRIDTRLRVAAWLAQLGHESGDCMQLVENLNYSAAALRRMWPSRVPEWLAQRIGRVDGPGGHKADQAAIAEAVYGRRKDLGNIIQGDGAKYIGRGALQITGYANYSIMAEQFAMHVDDVAEWLVTPEGAALAAAYYWQSRGLNELADVGDIDEISRRINGAKTIEGVNGLEDRRARYAIARRALLPATV